MSREEIKDILEHLYHMRLDTQAEMAQVKEDAMTDVSRARDLVKLHETLKLITDQEEEYKKKLEASK